LLNVFAPIFVKIEETKTSIQRIEVSINASSQADLSKIRLTAFGEDEHAKHTKFREVFDDFRRKKSNEFLEPIEIAVSEDTRYIKLGLNYGKDLLEDNYVT
jgi:hypothetical protein